MSTNTTPLPAPAANQAYFDVSALEAGHIQLSAKMYVTGAGDDEKDLAPSLSFLLRHSNATARVVFDLGLRKDTETYGPGVAEIIKKWFPIDIPQDVAESLRKGGLDPSEIDYVILSHVHWDHVGDHTPFTKAQFILGEGGKQHVENGYPKNPEARYLQSTAPEGRTTWVTYDTWKPIGPFERGYDFFGDGSLYLIDAFGHLHGHINVLVRTNATGDWLYLAGDSCHHAKLLTGEGEIAELHDHATGERMCAHVDKPKAEDHLRRIREAGALGVRVLLAHDVQWWQRNKGGDAYWPGKLASEGPL
ncbi:Metallo-hydrolase/oxidoreductase [Sistotremastrum suecicum HHB10207 ss-3]|uniref:Metallo-hydrolase/oxidoreductase n=1 Tax=Sistotremastrum suecicum HHB10207 ss-3 TaxID=1314776 RepID=A0A166BFT8_9AGAM|nr:Metallo-hydrolase/oxidoreductase [Sistotremastrum suecicum HHB10207 ss-3]